MKIVQIIGGIGNQMFQYAFLIGLRETFQEEVLMDVGILKHSYPYHTGWQMDQIFNITSRVASHREIRKVYHWFFLDNYQVSRVYKHYFPALKTEFQEKAADAFRPEMYEQNVDRYYIGYWQDYRYLKDFMPKIREELSFKQPLDVKNQSVFNELLSINSVSIHVRRGDYVGNYAFWGCCDLPYYRRAIEKVHSEIGKCRFLIFSNDQEWCMENILPLLVDDEYQFVDWNYGQDSYKDMQLMTACKVNIIANSSFSYWGAALNVRPDHIVIAPKEWTVNGQTAIRQWPEWELLSNEE